MDEIKNIIEEHKPHIIGISEANLHINAHKPSMHIEGYVVEIDNLHKVKCRSQIVIYIMSHIKYVRRTDLENTKIPNVWLEIFPVREPAYLLNVGYREWADQLQTPKEGRTMISQENRLEIMLSSWTKAAEEEKTLVIVGDWNVNMLPWINQDQTTSKPLLEMIQQAAADNNLTLLTRRATRAQGADEHSALDVIFTNSAEIISQIEYYPSSSDHQMIKCKIRSGPEILKQQVREARSYSKYTKEGFLELAQTIPTDHLLKSKDPDYVAKELTGMTNWILDKIAPYRKKVNRINHAPHLTPLTKELMKERNLLKEKANNSKDPDDRTAYKRVRNKIVRQVRRDKKEWTQNKIDGKINTSKQLWAVVNKINDKKAQNTIGEIITTKGIISDKTDIANHLNQFFNDKDIKIKAGLTPPPEPYVKILGQIPSSVPPMRMLEILPQQLDTYVKELKNSGANGVDSIPASVFKDAYSIWSEETLHMVNLSLCLGIFPQSLKTTKILPSVKNGKDPKRAESYRPISSLNMLAKILERAGFDQLLNHCNLHGIISEDQHGGRSQHSTTTCLLELEEAIQLSKANKLSSAQMGIDLSSAYNLCNLAIMEQQIRLAGADFLSSQWIMSFLSNRNQLVEIEGKSSATIKSLNMGLCQGGRSSGILFAIYTNSLPSCASVSNHNIKGKAVCIKQFVDDTNALISAGNSSELAHLIQHTYDLLEAQLQNLEMAINGEKTQLMLISPGLESEHISLMAGGAVIKHQASMKILGFTFADNRQMDQHLWKGEQNMIRSIRQKVSMLRVIKPFTSPSQLAYISNMVINSTISYAAPLWATTNTTNIEKIQAAQLKAARQIAWQKRTKYATITHRQDILHTLGWLNVTQIVNRAITTLVKKATINEASAGINSMFTINIKPNARIAQKFKTTTANTRKRTGRNFLDLGKSLFNDIPVELRDPMTRNFKFKRGFKIYTNEHHHLPYHLLA